MGNLMEELFEIWMEEYHPKYKTVLIVLGWIGVLGFVASIALMWFWPDWWKLLISSIAYFLLVGLVKHGFDSHYIEEFKSNKK